MILTGHSGGALSKLRLLFPNGSSLSQVDIKLVSTGKRRDMNLGVLGERGNMIKIHNEKFPKNKLTGVGGENRELEERDL